MKKWTPLLIIGGLFLLFFILVASSYNGLVAMRENTKQRVSQVQNVYQRRADLIPNLVETVKGYAKHEHDTLTEVTNARAKASSVNIDPAKLTPDSLARFQRSQGELSSALGRLMVVVERYPELKANENFRELQSQLEGTENRIAVERREFNMAAQAYNTAILTFPRNIVAGIFGFREFPYFEAEKGAGKAPAVKF